MSAALAMIDRPETPVLAPHLAVADGDKRAKPAAAQQTATVRPTAQVIAMRQRDPWREASERARQTAIQREILALWLLQAGASCSQSAAVGALLEQAKHPGMLPPHVALAMKECAKAGRSAPSRSTLFEWLSLYREGGIAKLLPEHKGRVVEAAAWWGPALEYFNAPSKPDMAAVHRKLVEVEHFAVSYEQVRNYLSSVPAMVGRYSPARLGKNLYRLTQKAYVRRSTQNALPGDVYVADGYRGDVYLAHPITGDIWRPEFTVAIDLVSRVPVGWRADEHEGTYAVQNMWAECFDRWHHVPPFLYVDNGSGYKNRFMDCAATGFYARAGVQQIIHAIPGNPHGKGWVERFFRIVKEDFIKLWKGGLYYCGDDVAPEHLRQLVADVKAKRVQLPSLAEFTADFNDWIARFVRRAHPENQDVSRLDIWKRLEPIPPAQSVAELKRQAVSLTVRRASVKHGKREYGHPDLHAWNHKTVVLEYDLMDNEVGVIRDESGRWICDAHLIKTIDAIPTNRLEEKRALRAADAIKRLEKKMDEQKARAGRVLDADALVDALPAPSPVEGEIQLFDL